ncbi:MAG: 2-succinyl-5-enolpyruvyl-6-hydroxy-3-cyclohexene-1-carboxylic-acid synthase, partial [Chitinophagales bacterium]
NAGFNLVSVIDERSAGFIALGISRASGNPTAVVTTSGSAALNLAPAMAEAYYDRIPLIAITADRPKNLVNCGENQTIIQQGIFRNFVNLELEIEEMITINKAETLFQKIYHFISNVRFRRPIHINMPFSEPLLNIDNLLGNYHFKLVEDNIAFKLPLSNPNVHCQGNIMVYNTIENSSGEISNILQKGISENKWLVVNEIQTNIKLSKSIEYFDKLIHNYRDELPKVKTIITIGNQMISKAARAYFKSIPNILHIDIAPYSRKWDAISTNYMFIESEEAKVLKNLLKTETNSTDFQNQWIDAVGIVSKKHESFFEEKTFKEWSVLHQIFEKTSTYANVFWGNSSLVRYASWSNFQSNIKHFVNRGVSGIDGVLSTAIGWQTKIESKNFFVVLGDVSALYEMNAFHSMHLISSINVLIFNNKGGMIFDNIHDLQGQNDVLTLHNYSFEHIANMVELEYFSVKNLKELEDVVSEFPDNLGKKRLIEIQFEEDSHRQWLDYFSIG